MATLTRAVDDLRASEVAAEVQQWLNSHHHKTSHDDTKENDSGNVYTRTFFSHLHLANRDPLPFGENYSVLLQPLSRDHQASAIEHAACVTRAALAFWTGLSLSADDERRQFLRAVEGLTDEGLPTECSQYFALFGSARLPAQECDTQHHARRLSAPPCFAVARRGRFYAVTLPELPASCLPSLDALRATFHAIATHAEDARSDGDVEEALLGLLTCMRRDDAAAWRARMVQEADQTLSTIQDALFLVCLDDIRGLTTPVSIAGVDGADSDRPRAEGVEMWRQLRSVFNGAPDLERDECNRWFEKGLQIIVAGLADGDVIVGANVEHSFADSGVVHKLCSYLWREARALLLSNAGHQDDSISAARSGLEWRHLAWGAIGEALRKQLRSVQSSMAEMARASTNQTIDSTIRGIGRQFFKSHGFSPDCCFQIAFNMACCLDEAKYVWNLETLDARHYRDGRLMIADVFTAQFKDLQASVFERLGMTKTVTDGPSGCTPEGGGAALLLRGQLEDLGSDADLVSRFEKAVRAHQQVLVRHKEGMECYLHLFFLTNEMGLLPDRQPHALSENPTYCEMYRNHTVGSNLGNDVGIEFVFSGIPPPQSMDVLGYMLADDHIKLTYTSRSDISPFRLPTLVSSLTLVKLWVEQAHTAHQRA